MNAYNPIRRPEGEQAAVMRGPRKELRSSEDGSRLLVDKIYESIHPGKVRPSLNDNSSMIALSEFQAAVRTFDFPEEKIDELRLAFIALLQEFSERNDEVIAAKMPVRDWRAREDIIAYIRSPHGLGPWLEAGQLTRPLMRKIAPKAYVALANWLRKPENTLESVGLEIPRKTEVVAQRKIDPAAVRAARKILARYQRTQNSGGSSRVQAGDNAAPKSARLKARPIYNKT